MKTRQLIIPTCLILISLLFIQCKKDQIIDSNLADGGWSWISTTPENNMYKTFFRSSFCPSVLIRMDGTYGRLCGNTNEDAIFHEGQTWEILNTKFIISGIEMEILELTKDRFILEEKVDGETFEHLLEKI